MTALVRFATVAKAQAVAGMPEERRIATLLAFVRMLEASARCDVLDLFDSVVTKVFADAATVGLCRLGTGITRGSIAIVLVASRSRRLTGGASRVTWFATDQLDRNVILHYLASVQWSSRLWPF